MKIFARPTYYLAALGVAEDFDARRHSPLRMPPHASRQDRRRCACRRP